MVEGNRLLFVDDEYGLRLTFPPILEMHGYEVRTAATVSEALSEITTHPFDVLISDLNIGEPGDGFTVVSAMRRTQPDCLNFILTGFPAFESALLAIQRQVDDYLVKPAKVEELVALIQKKMQERLPRHPNPLMRLSTLLREKGNGIVEKSLSKMKSHPALSAIGMSDQERVSHVPMLVAEIANQLDSSAPDESTDRTNELSRAYGLQRLSAGYEISMLVTDTTLLENAVFDIVREHLLLLDTSNLVLDLKHFGCGLQVHLEQSVQAYWNQTVQPRGMERKYG
jgi:ActR/RegA family two-component response regulator